MALGGNSAASAASAAIDHVRDWVYGTNGKWTSMAVPSEGLYGESKGLYFSYPVVCKNGDYEIVKGLSIDDFSRQRLEETNKELLGERDGVKAQL
jgi:malate dehydrogenase